MSDHSLSDLPNGVEWLSSIENLIFPDVSAENFDPDEAEKRLLDALGLPYDHPAVVASREAHRYSKQARREREQQSSSKT